VTLDGNIWGGETKTKIKTKQNLNIHDLETLLLYNHSRLMQKISSCHKGLELQAMKKQWEYNILEL